ncbi:type VI secretion system membrane subunit TssM [uncultured Tateyamaria sp.]|uniref:type VI secretion system membrane subunit TssM n=1 Tax=uncultured Tateyamaria sp. TaxID=455651 RepID=UPI002617885C|nr:type VI secretion system membrane subunit TssM [uncultured Tateyamaria sp.]
MTRLFTWLSALITTLGVISLCVAIWIGLPISGIDWLSTVPVRAGLIAGILTLLLLGALVRWRARRKAAADLENSLLATQAGDGPLLAERMRAALVRLKKTGGASALYDLPWYILIGPPGAGKTTALVHSGLEFPGEHAASITGFGGTKNCDFWFAEEAVMIDTAGRYTTQDSDETADRNSWTSFLGQLKTARPDQPINGVILAFSCEDMMTESTDGLRRHAETVRARLAELNDAFKTHVPVYVIFTKADMISGFREYFGSFDEARRRGVWGATFQTRNRREETHRAVSREFDQLVSRLSDEVTDRLIEEKDSAARIAIYDFPEQMALLERNVTTFLSAVFEKPQAIRAILRGFYFTSGTQGGTPIDQVLGAMSGGAGGAAATGFLSGKGRSYFLHDLLTKVVFAERDWVGYDRGRVLRRTVGRAFGKGFITLISVAVMAVLGFSFWTNATLVREVAGQTQAYEQRASAFLGPQRIDNPATRPLLPALGTLRAMPAGYANPRPQELVQDLGLSRRDALRGAAVQAYSDGLEQMLRPRMMLQVEQDLAQYLGENRKIDAYRALKVYILLAKEQDGREDDLAIQSYFAQAWAEDYAGADSEYRAINAHLAAMLELDGRVTPLVAANGALIARVREAIADVPPADRAYGAIRSRAGTLPPWRLAEAMADAPIATADARPVETLGVPGLFTFEGYWGHFEAALQDAAAQLEADAWVLGVADTQPLQSDAALFRDVHVLYARDFERAWSLMLDRVALAPPEGGTDALADAAGALLVRLSEVVQTETRLTDFSSNALKSIGNFAPSDEMTVQARFVERPFVPWHRLLEGAVGTRPLDRVLEGLAEARRVALTGQGDLGTVLPREVPVPSAVERLVGQVLAALSVDYVDAQLVALDRARCVPGAPPVGAQFGAVFGYGGQMQRLQQSAPGPVSVRARARFDAAAAVRAAMFVQGQADAVVPFAVRLMLVNPAIEPVTIILGDQVLELTSGGAPARAVWTETTPVSLAVPDAPPATLIGGGWSILTFLSGDTLQSRGPLAQVAHRIGPYTATFRLEFQGTDVPFLSDAFKEITCQNALE